MYLVLGAALGTMGGMFGIGGGLIAIPVLGVCSASISRWPKARRW
jgi:uncharacterized membrane protein YfcA